MSIDDRIRQELESEAEEIDEVLNDKQGMIELQMLPLKSGLRNWVIIVMVVILLVAGLIFWCGYEFIYAENVDNRIYWGVLTIVTVNIMMGLKAWAWMEAYRCSLLREVKRVEVAVARLTTKIETT